MAKKNLQLRLSFVWGLTHDILLKPVLSIRFSAAFSCFINVLCCVLSLEKKTRDNRSCQVLPCCYSNRVFSRYCCFQSLGMRAYSTAGWESSISKSSASLHALLYGNWTVFSHLKPRVTACLLTYEKTWPWEEILHESLWSISKNQLVHYQMEIWDICRTKWKWLMLFSHLLLITQIYHVLCVCCQKLNASHVIQVQTLLFFLF